MLLALVIAIDTSKVFEVFNQGIDMMATAMAVSNSTIIIFALLFIAIGYMSYIMMVFAGISLGQSHNSNKLVFSVVWSIGLYYASQIISVIFLGIMALSNPGFIDALNQDMPTPDIMKQIIMFSFVSSLSLMVIYYIISHNRLKHLSLQ